MENNTEQGLDAVDVVDTVVSSEAGLALAAERLTTRLGRKVTTYDIITVILKSSSASKNLAEQLRTLAIIKMYDLLTNVSNDLISRLDELSAKDLAATHGRLLSGFNSLTAPATKLTFDFDDESKKAAEALGLDMNEVQAELKQIMAKANGNGR